jgi:TIR domain
MTAPIHTGSGRIFISYRREETAYPAGWLYDRLVEHFGHGQVFKDIDSIGLGDDFVEVITQAVESCDVLLALIGERWSTVTDAGGRRRIDDPDDFVRLEVEAALDRGVLVIPILVDGAAMPPAEELPAGLDKLVRRQALELSPGRFDSDTKRLVEVLDRTIGEPGAAGSESGLPEVRHRRTNLPVIAGIAAAVLAGAVLLVVLIGLIGGSGDDDDPDPAAVVSGDDLELSDLQRSIDEDEPQVGDTMTVSYTLTNVGEQDVEMVGTFVAARNPDDDNLDTDYSNNGSVLAPGESVDTEVEVPLDSPGTWYFWPCYELADGSLCPDEWQRFSVTATE